MMRKFLGLCSSFLLVTFALGARADLLVAPGGNAGTSGSGQQFGIFDSGGAVTFQWDLKASELTGMVGDTITGIGFRLPSGGATIATPTTVGTWNLELSGSLNAFGSLNANPANNIAPGAVTVYDQSLVIPANAFVGGSSPNAFYIINFTTPYTYTGGDLLMTVIQPGIALSLAVDANAVADGNGDTAACFGTQQCQAHFFNYPITEFQFTSTTTAVPEPASIALLSTALVGLGTICRRRKRAKAIWVV